MSISLFNIDKIYLCTYVYLCFKNVYRYRCVLLRFMAIKLNFLFFSKHELQSTRQRNPIRNTQDVIVEFIKIVVTIPSCCIRNSMFVK